VHSWLRSEAGYHIFGDGEDLLGQQDPIVADFHHAPQAAEVEDLDLDSEGLERLKKSGVAMIVPFITHGELIGWLGLGSRLSGQEYSADDRILLSRLAVQAAPSVRVAQLVAEQQAETLKRERLEQELSVARQIQIALLPKEMPDLVGWRVATHYQPARAVGGDFYDFVRFDDGRLGIFIGDVTDKGIPAALVMATTRTLLRAVANPDRTPGEVLERVNDLLQADIPDNMFVTCLYAILDPCSGALVYANAGHNLPYAYTDLGVVELRATGMPLGLMPNMAYEDKDTLLNPGVCVIFYSDGLVEAHNKQREMFGNSRLIELLRDEYVESTSLVERLLCELREFTGEGWEQEDDITLVGVKRDL
jgi:serine phosphatase RsbU (regulator of sigma subunit)